jgi:hypothetical protein
MRRNPLIGGLTLSILTCLLLSCVSLILLPPPNPLWALFSGYYRYDPRHEAPPQALMLDRPEESLRYFLDATLKLCNSVYPPGQHRQVQHYEVELVEYFGKTDYHAFSNVHTRLYFTDGASILAVFRFEAGHNEHDLLLSLGEASTIRAGSWMALGSLVRDPDRPPPGWRTYQENERPFMCQQAGPPYTIIEWRYEPTNP